MKTDKIVALNEPVKLAVSTLVLNVSSEIQKKNLSILILPSSTSLISSLGMYSIM